MRLNRTTAGKVALPPGKSDHIVFDDSLAGFGLRIRASGKRYWIVQYRATDKTRRVTLGPVDLLTPEEARERAGKILAQVRLGEDPQAARAEAKARASVTLGRLVDTYLTRYAAPKLKATSLRETTRYLNGAWRPLHDLPLDKIDRRLVATRLAEIAATSGATAANRARAALSAFFSWTMREGIASANPVVGSNRSEEKSRDRVLSDAELVAIWNACGDDDFGRIVRLLILTGQRRAEIGDLAWNEVDLTAPAIKLPAARSKNKRAHEIPLSPLAFDVLAGVHKRERPLVFGEGDGGFSGWSKAKAALDARVAAAGTQIEAWRLHDLRRTVATGMIGIGVLPHVVEAVLNHVSGHLAGVAGVYNRAKYTTEKRQALDRWAAHVDAIVYRQPSNVLPLRAGS
jgi:integrase